MFSIFKKQVQEILVVTDANGFGGSKIPTENHWWYTCGITAWKKPNGQMVIENKHLEITSTESMFKTLSQQVKANGIYRVQIKESGGKLIFVKALGEDSDQELAEFLKEQVSPIIYEDEIFGTFTLDKRVNWYEAKVKWICGTEIDLNIDTGSENINSDNLITAHAFWENREKWNADVRAYAAVELTDLANEWLQGDDQEITKEDFARRIGVESITFCENQDDGFDIWFNDDDIFRGHAVVVIGNLKSGCESAQIVG